jgi:hypothetical protein
MKSARKSHDEAAIREKLSMLEPWRACGVGVLLSTWAWANA